MKHHSNTTSFFEIIQILFSILLASIGLKAFLLPNNFLDGGVTGVAILISKLSHLEVSIILPLASVPFFVLAWFHLPKALIIKSLVSLILLAIMIHFENFQPITEDKLIISIFGGIFLGAGIGLAIKNGTVLDGSEILGIIVHDRYGVSIGNIILGFNIILFALTAVILSVEIALYSILTYIVTAKVIDFMIKGFEDYVGLTIISSQSEAIRQNLREEIGQGITVYETTKGYGRSGEHNNGEVIQTVINRIDTKRCYNAIENIDTEAFIIEFDVNHVKGGLLRPIVGRSSSLSKLK